MDDRGAFLRLLTRVLAEPDAHRPVTARLCDSVGDLVQAHDSAIAVWVETTDGPERSVLCVSSEAAHRFEDVQDLARQGPSYDARRTAGPVHSADLAAERDRWPVLVEAMAAAGVDSTGVLALPMRPAQHVVGVLSLRTVEHRDLAAGPDDLRFFADTIGAVLLDELAHGGAEPWAEADVVAQATGMVVAQLDLEPSDALAVLRARAFVERRPVVEISHRVVGRDLHFRDERIEPEGT